MLKDLLYERRRFEFNTVDSLLEGLAPTATRSTTSEKTSTLLGLLLPAVDFGISAEHTDNTCASAGSDTVHRAPATRNTSRPSQPQITRSTSPAAIKVRLPQMTVPFTHGHHAQLIISILRGGTA